MFLTSTYDTVVEDTEIELPCILNRIDNQKSANTVTGLNEQNSITYFFLQKISCIIRGTKQENLHTRK